VTLLGPTIRISALKNLAWFDGKLGEPEKAAEYAARAEKIREMKR